MRMTLLYQYTSMTLFVVKFTMFGVMHMTSKSYVNVSHLM